MKQIFQKKKIPLYLFLIFFSALLLYTFGNDILDKILLSKNYSYTLSERISYSVGSKATGARSKYTFMVNGEWYFGFASGALKKDGTRYFIRYYPPNPWRNETTFVIADSTDIKNLPKDGYKELPHK